MLIRIHAQLRNNYEVRELYSREKNYVTVFQENRDEIREHAKENIENPGSKQTRIR